MQQVKEGNIIDVLNQRIFKGKIYHYNGIITQIEESNQISSSNYILPGFVDSHIHIESSMLPPSEFARHAVIHGTVATVSDPHEIGNVLGITGVDFMINDGKKVPFKFYFGAPSCVPATTFETAGAVIGPDEIENLLKRNEVHYLAEVMNFPGVIAKDQDMMEKIALAKKYNKQIDGHAPGLRGEQARKYFSAGITTDHECFFKEEALDKLKLGVKILIREGSAAKNFEALIDLFDEYYKNIMFCSDDLHPNDLMRGHINLLVKRALNKGNDLMKVLQAACVNPVKHYKLNVGLIQQNDPADFIIIDNPKEFNVLETYINGDSVAANGKTKINRISVTPINNFNCEIINEADLEILLLPEKMKVIEVKDGQLVTSIFNYKLSEADTTKTLSKKDILKLVVVNRYNKAKPAVAFVKNFGLTEGAIASSIAHDSHNIIATGTNDSDIVKAVNKLIQHGGGISAVNGSNEKVLPLEIAGLMSTNEGVQVANDYEVLDALAKKWGCTLTAPYMTLSFLALLVIPELKLSDKGLFDVTKFSFTSMFDLSD